MKNLKTIISDKILKNIHLIECDFTGKYENKIKCELEGIVFYMIKHGNDYFVTDKRAFEIKQAIKTGILLKTFKSFNNILNIFIKFCFTRDFKGLIKKS